MSHQENPATEEVQQQLVDLWKDGHKDQFKKQVVNLVTKHDNFFKLMGIHGGSAQTITRKEFIEYFKFCFQESLSNAIFSAVAGDKNECSIVNVHIYFHGKRSTIKQRKIVKDATWLWNRLQQVDLKDLDKDGNLTIEKEELRNYFKHELDVAIVDGIFDAIDTDGSGQISPKEFFIWRTNSKIPSIETILQKACNRLTSPEDYGFIQSVESSPDPLKHDTSLAEPRYEASPSPVKQEETPVEAKSLPVPVEEKSSPSPVEESLPAPVEEVVPNEPIVIEYELRVQAVAPILTANAVAASTTDATKISTKRQTEKINGNAIEDTNKKTEITVEQSPPAPDNTNSLSTQSQPVQVESQTQVQLQMLSVSYETVEQPETLFNAQKDITTSKYYEVIADNSTLSPTKRTWIMSKKSTHWRECEVIDENDTEIQVHYISYHPKFDEWIPKSSNRIQAKRPTAKLQKGDNISAWHPKAKEWKEAEVEEIDKEKERVRIAYVFTADVAYVPLRSSKISMVHKNSSDPFFGPVDEAYEFVNNAQESNDQQDAKNTNVQTAPLGQPHGCCSIM